MSSSLSIFIFIVLFNINEIFSSPVDNSKTVALFNEYELNPFGDYYYKYQLSDGQAVDVTGRLKEVDGNQVYVVTGSYSYVGTDGNVYTVNYIADENGYRIVNGNVATGGYSYHTTPRPTRPPFAAPTIPPLKPGVTDEINPRTIIGTFG